MSQGESGQWVGNPTGPLHLESLHFFYLKCNMKSGKVFRVVGNGTRDEPGPSIAVVRMK